MKAVCEKYVRANLVKSETLPIFVVPRFARSNDQAVNIFLTADKAGFLRQVYSLDLRILADFEGGSPSLYTYDTNFFLKMPRSEKVSADAQGVSIATVSARNSASKPIPAKPTKRYYQVSIYAKRNDICVANLHCSHPYLATSREEAIGMAVDHVKAAWPKYMICAQDVTCCPLNLKSM